MNGSETFPKYLTFKIPDINEQYVHNDTSTFSFKQMILINNYHNNSVYVNIHMCTMHVHR